MVVSPPNSLYLIEILHQTTTPFALSSHFDSCILLKFYIKPQHRQRAGDASQSCILLKFYIKPQHQSHRSGDRTVVSYWNSTSNHNCYPVSVRLSGLYLIEILHQTTTFCGFFPLFQRCILLKFYIKPQPSSIFLVLRICCILLKFYIKPQHRRSYLVLPSVVSYWNSTSNHNCSLVGKCTFVLYLIEILHQTTTSCEIVCISK